MDTNHNKLLVEELPDELLEAAATLVANHGYTAILRSLAHAAEHKLLDDDTADVLNSFAADMAAIEICWD